MEKTYMNKTYGYARISSATQNLDGQVKALIDAGVQESDIITETVTGNFNKTHLKDRALYKDCLRHIRSGDTLVIYSLDRLGRTMIEVCTIVDELTKQGVLLISIKENIDTTNPMGRAMAQMVAIFAEMERERIRERVNTGLAAARARGRVGGRPAKLTQRQQEQVKTLYASKEHTLSSICEQFNISKPTLYKIVKS